MDLGATKGELWLVAFVFVLVYAAGLLPRLGARLGRVIAGRRKQD
jgi:Sec-independent protein translocase protein TatA